jgi:hypothetical protein
VPPSDGTQGVPVVGVLDGQPLVLASTAASAPLLDAPELLLALPPELLAELLPPLDPLTEPLLAPELAPDPVPELPLAPELLLEPDAPLDAPPDPPPPDASSPESDVPEVELELPHATTSAERIANVGFLIGPPGHCSPGAKTEYLG